MRKIFLLLFLLLPLVALPCLAQPALNSKPKQSQKQKSPSKDLNFLEPSTTNNHQGIDVKLWEIRTSPLAFLVRWLTVELGYRINEQIVVGPSAIFYAGSTMPWLLGYRGHAIGFFGTYNFKSLQEPGLYGTFRYYHEDYTSYPNPDSSLQVKRDIKGHTGTFILGYYVPFSKPLFALLGGGAQVQVFDKTNYQGTNTTIENHQLKAVPYIEAKLGLEF